MNRDSKRLIETINNRVLFCEIEKMLAEGRQASFTVMGYSMYPFLVSGRDSVIVESLEGGKPIKGDILLFKPLPDRYMLHRVTRVTAEGFETTGDRNMFRDGLFPFSCIIGKASAIVRKGKTIPCSNGTYRFLYKAWGMLFPFRKTLIHLWGSLHNWWR